MTGDHDHDWKKIKKLVERFENSLKSNLDLYFEEEELEDIIRFYFDQQKFLKALRASEYALEKFPFSVEIRLLKAQCLIFNDELEEGLGILENLNNLSPNNEDIVLALANAQILAGNHQEGIELLENYLPLAEDKAEVFYSLGNLYRAKGDNAKASDYFKEAVKNRINHEDALFQLAMITEEEVHLTKFSNSTRNSLIRILILPELGTIWRGVQSPGPV